MNDNTNDENKDIFLDLMKQTIAHYNESADSFWEGTRYHDVSQNIDSLIAAIDYSPPFEILDFGCGPGRDLKHFQELGHNATGLEGSSTLAQMARAYSKCDVLSQNFNELKLEANSFHGIFANASLFHAPTSVLPKILDILYASLKPGGVLLSSNPLGEDQEGMYNGRYASFHSLQNWRTYMQNSGFHEHSHYYRPPNIDRALQNWLASLWLKENLKE